MKLRSYADVRVASKGFSLAEVLVATGIVGVALAPIVFLLTTSIRQASVVQDQLIAGQLAQEGVEIVRAVRDENWINAAPGRPFYSGLAAGTWLVDYRRAALLPFSAGEPLRIEAGTGFYYHGAGVPSRFFRTIHVVHNPSASPREIRVQSVVSWTTRGIPFSVTVEDHLFDWLPI